MLVFTGSPERTEGEYRDLLHRAGLTLVKTIPTASLFSILEAIPLPGRLLWVIDAQDGAIAWWYVVFMVFAALSFAVAGTWARAALTVGLVISALAAPVALLNLGALLAPPVVAAAIALVVIRPGAHTRAPTEEPQPSQERGVAR